MSTNRCTGAGGRGCLCAWHAKRRAPDRRGHQRRRDAELAARNLHAHRCQRRQGSGRCNALLETNVGEFGRTIVTCPACERRKRGVCRDCPRAVDGMVGRALRCAQHKELARREQMRASNERHAEANREKYREYYHRPDVNARRNDYKREYRRLHPDKVRAQKQRYIERHRNDPNSRYNRYHAKYREKYRLQRRELERDRLVTNPPPRKTAPKCTKCGKSTRWKPIPHGNSGRPWTVCTPCPAERAALSLLRGAPMKPTRRELEILRWVNAGAELYPVGTTQYRIAGIAAVGPNELVQRRVIERLQKAGWLSFTPRHAFLTLRGRDVAELSASVRVFSESTQLSTPST